MGLATRFCLGGIGPSVPAVLGFDRRISSLENRAEYDKANDAVERIESSFGYHSSSAKPLTQTDEPISNEQSNSPSAKYADLFKPGYAGRTTMFMGVWIFQALGFYGFTVWVPTLLVAHGFSMVKSLS